MIRLPAAVRRLVRFAGREIEGGRERLSLVKKGLAILCWALAAISGVYALFRAGVLLTVLAEGRRMTGEEAGLFTGDTLGTLLIGGFAWGLALLGRRLWYGPTEEYYACPRCGRDFQPDEYLAYEEHYKMAHLGGDMRAVLPESWKIGRRPVYARRVGHQGASDAPASGGPRA